jgi:hypothetical protein
MIRQTSDNELTHKSVSKLLFEIRRVGMFKYSSVRHSVVEPSGCLGDEDQLDTVLAIGRGDLSST